MTGREVADSAADANHGAQDAGAVFSFDVARWLWHEWIVGAGSLAVLISLFRGWFSLELVRPGERTLRISVHGNIIAVHPWLKIVLVLTIAILALLMLRACTAGSRVVAEPSGVRQLLAGATAVNLLLVLWVVRMALAAEKGRVDPQTGIWIRWTVHWQGAAALVALAGALMAAVAAWTPASRHWTRLTSKSDRRHT